MRAIAAYLRERNPAASKAQVARIRDSIRRLRILPSSGRLGRVEGTFELVVPDTRYIVVYRLIGQVVEVVAVRHTARQWPQSFDPVGDPP